MTTSAAPSALHLRAAVNALLRGGIVACPTEAVWGLSCDPYNQDAVDGLLLLKRRPVAKGLILVAASTQQLEFLLCGLSRQQRETVLASWPGPNTWLVPHNNRVPGWIHGNFDTVAVRISDHPGVRALCKAWGGPLVSTSANRAGARPAREAYQVRRYFGNALDVVLPGNVGTAARPSTIRDVRSGQIVRA